MAMNNRRYRSSGHVSSSADARERGRKRALHQEKPAIPGIAWFLIIVAAVTIIATLCINSRNEEMEATIAAAEKRNAEINKKNAETKRKAQEERERRKREKEEKMASMRAAAEQQQQNKNTQQQTQPAASGPTP